MAPVRSPNPNPSFKNKSLWRLMMGALLWAGCLAFLGGCTKKQIITDRKDIQEPPPPHDGPSDLPPSPKPLISSFVKGRTLHYKISNTSGHTFHKLLIMIRGSSCEGRAQRRYWRTFSRRPIFDGGTQRFRWGIPTPCGDFEVKAIALRAPSGRMRLKIHSYRPPYVRYSISNRSRGITYRGFLIHITGSGCRNRKGWLHQRVISLRNVPPGFRLTQTVRLRGLCRSVRVHVTRLTPQMKRRIAEYLLRRRRLQRHRDQGGASPEGPDNPRPPHGQPHPHRRSIVPPTKRFPDEV